MSDPVLELVDVSVATRSGTTLLDAVDLRIGPGEVVGLVGESGSGKSLLVRSAVGSLPRGLAVRGRILLRGVDLLAVSSRARRAAQLGTMATVPQDALRALNPVLRIGRQVGEVVRLRRPDLDRAAVRRRVLDLFDMVGIPRPEQTADGYPHMISGGMCQRVMIAIALASEPMLLLADEPTTALDASVQRQIIDLLRSVGDELGLALLFVSHDLGVIAEISDRIEVMYAGQIVESGAKATVLRHPGHPYTSALLRCVADLEGDDRSFAQIPGSVPNPSAWPVGCRYHLRCDHHASGRCDAGRVELDRGSSGAAVRCVRSGELVLRGVG